jgi:hypothetical protein
MNYQIITNEEKLKQFIDFLPELSNNECYYVSLFARKKYCSLLKNDKQQLKRFVAKKDYLYDKIKQLETEIGTYKVGNIIIPNEALAVYITPNPRSNIKAAIELQYELLRKLLEPEKTYDLNINALSLNHLQTSGGTKYFMDFDYDNVILDEILLQISESINLDACSVVITRGGFHLLVHLNKIKKEYVKSWYNNLTKIKNCDVRGSDNLLPIPGTTQGNFTPVLIENLTMTNS